MSIKELQIATIGKAVALRGELKLHLQCDFSSQFKKGSTFKLANGNFIEIESFTSQKSLIKFVGYNSREEAQKLTNQKLFTSMKETIENCTLKEGEFFWFNLIGSRVLDDELYLGDVFEIERIGVVDYLVVKTSDNLVEKELSDKFYIPYIDEYVIRFDKDAKEILTKDALLLLEAS
jgi:16S rRNA processing protein RimM